MTIVSALVLENLNKQASKLIEELTHNSVEVTEFRGCIVGGSDGVTQDAFWVPLLEIGDDVKIRVYGSFFEVWLIDSEGDQGWVPAYVTGNFKDLYEYLIHL